MHDSQVWRPATGPVALDRGQQKPARRARPRVGDDLAIWAVEPIQRVQPGIQQRVAPPKRPHCFFDIIRPIPMEARIAGDG